jgi:long-subunit fatty acid transport protein
LLLFNHLKKGLTGGQQMKKTIIIFASCVFLTWSYQSSAAPVGNPTNVKQVEGQNWSGDAEVTFVFDRDLDRANGELDEEREAYAKIGYIPDAYPVEFYGLLGTMSFEVNQGSLHYETDYGLAYGFGAKAQIWKDDDSGTAVGLDAKYRRSEPEIDESTFGDGGDVTYQDWQIALGVSQKIENNLTPYGGIKYNDVSIKDLERFSNQNSDDVIGLFVGVDYAVSDTLALNIEGNFVNETALTGAIAMKF